MKPPAIREKRKQDRQRQDIKKEGKKAMSNFSVASAVDFQLLVDARVNYGALIEMPP